jgi:hypothetical protein
MKKLEDILVISDMSKDKGRSEEGWEEEKGGGRNMTV